MNETRDATEREGRRGQARATFLQVINEATTGEKVRDLVDQALTMVHDALLACRVP